MNPEDQMRYGGMPPSEEFYARHPEMAPPVVPPMKTDRLERDEQRQFCNWCLLHSLPFVWHGTHKRSSANLGVPDFLVGIAGTWLCLEFKRDYACQLTKEQEEFCERCLAQGLVYKIVYNCAEAIKAVEEADSL
jgi:hypothetical protein